MSSDSEDFVFYGTPIEREEEISSRRKKAVAEASGQLRTLPPWKQEVTDEEGRRRFHGAFTGGYSAGYYNTVGSKEGWTPQSFTSSRKNRSEVNKQDIYNFLDEDEKAELSGRSLGMSVQFDTFGFTAAELARKQADKEQQHRPSTIPGPVPDELIVPAAESIGVKLLLRMGWRQGRSIKSSNKNSMYDARREARKAFLALSSDNTGSQLDEEVTGSVPDLPNENDYQLNKITPVYVLNPKQDLYGLGFDPFKQAPEFREKKRQRIFGNLETERHRPLSTKGRLVGKVAPGFGIGALEDLDEEDEDIFASGYDFQDTYVQEIEEPSKGLYAENLRILDTAKAQILDRRENDVLPGFKVASKSDGRMERFDPPAIPKDFNHRHKFTAPLGNNTNFSEISPPEVPPPENDTLKVLIEGVATLVARCGKVFEDLSKEKNQSNPLFAFLSGGNGSDFYVRKLWEERQKRSEKDKPWGAKIFQNEEKKLTAEKRGKILGEKSLERSSKESSSLVGSASSVNVQFKLSDTFTKPASLNEDQEITKPFISDPPKQKRFEQFLKEKYEGGLRTKESGGSSKMSESARARERLEFESAAEAIEKIKLGKESQANIQLLQDLSASAALQFTTGGIEKVKGQQDEEFIVKTMHPKREEFQWRPTPILCKRFDLVDPYMGKPPPPPRMKSKMDSLIFTPDSIKIENAVKHVATEPRETTEKEVESAVEVENVERPVDLYKAIFSDDSDVEEETPMSRPVDDYSKNNEEAAKTTLSHLKAGDFLESLGKELGLVVPPYLPHKSVARNSHKETVNVEMENTDHRILTSKESENVKNPREDRIGERSVKNSKSHKHKSSSSDNDASDSSRDRNNGSRSKRKSKGSSSGSRKHSKHHKHRRSDYPSRSHRSSGKEHDEDRKRKKHKYRE